MLTIHLPNMDVNAQTAMPYMESESSHEILKKLFSEFHKCEVNFLPSSFANVSLSINVIKASHAKMPTAREFWFHFFSKGISAVFTQVMKNETLIFPHSIAFDQLKCSSLLGIFLPIIFYMQIIRLIEIKMIFPAKGVVQMCGRQ